jgi:hypothetical protein
MNKNSINFISTIIIAFILSQFLPWWSVMLAAFITGLFISLKKLFVFLIPFLAIALFWMVYAFMLSNSNDFTLAKKIAVLFPLQGNPYLLIFITGLIGGIAAGISGVFGNQCKNLFIQSN